MLLPCCTAGLFRNKLGGVKSGEACQGWGLAEPSSMLFHLNRHSCNSLSASLSLRRPPPRSSTCPMTWRPSPPCPPARPAPWHSRCRSWLSCPPPLPRCAGWLGVGLGRLVSAAQPQLLGAHFAICVRSVGQNNSTASLFFASLFFPSLCSDAEAPFAPDLSHLHGCLPAAPSHTALH